MPRSRWLQPRFEGEVVRDELPADLLDALAARAHEHGMRVVEDAPQSQATYRVAPTKRMLVFEPAEPMQVWDSVRVWQEGVGSLRYAGTIRTWGHRLLPALLACVPICALLLVDQTRGAFAFIVASIGLVLLSTVALLVMKLNARQAERWVHAFLEGEVMRAAGAMPFGLKREPLPEPKPAIDLSRKPPAVRIAPSDPALAAAARVAHDAIPRHRDVDPRDEVQALEARAKRGA